MDNLEDVITASLEDAELPAEATTPEAEVTPEPAVETAPAAPETPSETPVDPTLEVASPATRDEHGRFLPKEAAKPVEDDFEKKFGLKQQADSGRENRIPYSRVKKITEKAVKDATDAKLAEFQPQLTEFQTKIADYEGRLQKVAEFEHILMNDTDQFLQMLSQIPAYQPFFNAVRDALNGQAPPAEATPQAPVGDDMPSPDQELSDGTMVYSMEGLKALNAWNRSQARKEVMDEVSKRYEPIENEWKAHQKLQAVIPQVQAQINTARTWKGFNENEPEIIKALQADGALTLKEAYYQVIDKIRDTEHTKWEAEKASLQANRDKMRAELLAELKQAPRATSAPSSGSKPTPESTNTGSMSLEDIIKEQVKTIKS